MTVKVKRDTHFTDILEYAIKYWKLNKSKYIITDEYFDDLSLYEENVYIFFKHHQSYSTYQSKGGDGSSENLAIVNIVKKDPMCRPEVKAVELDADGVVSLKGTLDPNFKKISKYLQGLEREKNPTDAEVRRYMEHQDPNKITNHPWILIIGLMIFILNIVSVEFHYNFTASYWFSSTIASFINKEFTFTNDRGENETLSFYDITKYDQLSGYFSTFIPDNFYAESVSDTDKYNNPFLGERKILYGPFRYHITKVKYTN